MQPGHSLDFTNIRTPPQLRAHPLSTSLPVNEELLQASDCQSSFFHRPRPSISTRTAASPASSPNSQQLRLPLGS